MQRRRLLLVAATTGYQTRLIAEEARSHGIEPVLATDRCHRLEDPWGDQAIPVHFQEPEKSAEEIARELKEPVQGVLALGDTTVQVAAAAAKLLGLPFHPPEAVHRARDKYLAREAFSRAGLRVPRYRTISLRAEAEAVAQQIDYPCVLKPRALSASQGVIRADSPGEFIEAFCRIKRLLADPHLRGGVHGPVQDVLVEDYIEGKEFAVEGVLNRGRLKIFAIFDKPDPLCGPYFEETIYTTPSREPEQVQRLIADTVEKAVRALGLYHGPIHAELRVNREGAWMLEVAGRPIGGLCSRVLRFEPDRTLEQVLVLHAVGEDIEPVQLRKEAAGVMMIPVPRAGIYAGVRGLEKAKQVDLVESVIITAKEGQKILLWPEGSSYLGFIFARGSGAEAVEQALRRAHAQLEFQLQPILPVLKL